MQSRLLMDWPAGVAINLDTIGGPFIVESTREAAILLMDHWPVEQGRAFLHALDLCAEALEDEAPANEARLAFVAAAEEAHILVRLH
ncbi:DUF982 domain-containing protein [Shinella sp. G-2]|uniref:DUF982 domain-containing protein n=1 Tax=Shinella sp. G-2 TaxID=3133141 RepID=UPI003D041A54